MELITHRRQADALLGNKLGRYGYADLNRVEQAVKTLAGYAKCIHADPKLTCKTDWGLPGAFSPEAWPVKSQMVRYLSNVRALGERYAPQCPLPQSMENLPWQGANQIEQALLCVREVLVERLHTFQFSGELIAGEENTV